MTAKYYAHGKLLLTGEYLVLQGAKALALPLQLGQSMIVSPGNKKDRITWEAFTPGNRWFSCEFLLPGFTIIQSTDSEKSKLLKKIFETIQILNPKFPFEKSLSIQTQLEFDPYWGLGSSSTLVANLANWTNVDPYKLNEIIFNGSGYDIACANAEGPVLYKIDIPPVHVKPEFPFQNNLFFVYSGRKKNTGQEISRFMETKDDTSKYVDKISAISETIAQSKTINDFQKLIREHEKIISIIINEPPVQNNYFSNFNGVVKSLGAWGGDFYLAASSMNEKETNDYFKKKGLQTIFPWNELVLNSW